MSQLEAGTHGLIGEHLLEYVMNDSQTLPLGNRHWKFAPQGCYRCKGEDKWITLTVRSEAEWSKFCEVLGHPEWISDPLFATRVARMENHDLLDRMIEEWTILHIHHDVMQILQSCGIPSGEVIDVDEIRNSVHLRERAYFTAEKSGSGLLFMGMPFKFTRAEGKVHWRGPELGQHNEYVLCQLLGRSQDEVTPVKDDDIGTAFDPE